MVYDGVVDSGCDEEGKEGDDQMLDVVGRHARREQNPDEHHEGDADAGARAERPSSTGAQQGHMLEHVGTSRAVALAVHLAHARRAAREQGRRGGDTDEAAAYH